MLDCWDWCCLDHTQHFYSSKYRHILSSWCQSAQIWFYVTTALYMENLRQVLKCASLGRGTLLVLQDWCCCCPFQRSVLSMILVTVVPKAFRSLTASSHVVLGWSTTFLMIVPMRCDLTWSFIISFISEKSHQHLLPKRLANGCVAHSSLVHVYSLVLDDSSLVLPMVVQRMETDWLIERLIGWLTDCNLCAPWAQGQSVRARMAADF